MDHDRAIARVEELLPRHKGEEDLLNFARGVIRFQKEIYRRVRAHPKADAQKLDTTLLGSFLPDFLHMVEKFGPRELSSQAQRFQERQDWEAVLRGCWQQSHDRLEVIARLILQPYVQYLSERWHVEVGGLGEGTGSCPFCSRAPLMAVLNGNRRLVCSFCSHEWGFPERTCPGCHAQKIEVVRHRSYPHLRIEACEACGHYLKTLDLRKEPGAVPIIDELVSVPLDKLARHKGLVKLEVNLAGQ